MPPYHNGAAPTLPLFETLKPILPESHADRGKAWEAELDRQHRIYAERGWYIRRAYLPSVPIGDGDTARIIGRAAPDYYAARGGVWIVFDAKSHEGARWPLAEVSAWDSAPSRQPANLYSVAAPVLKAAYLEAGLPVPTILESTPEASGDDAGAAEIDPETVKQILADTVRAGLLSLRGDKP